MPNQIRSVHDIARFDCLNRNAFGQIFRLGVKRKQQPQGIDELIAFGEGVAIVQAALELVAEQRRQALAVANSLDNPEREPDSFRRKIYFEQIRLRGRRVRNVAVSQNSGSYRVID